MRLVCMLRTVRPPRPRCARVQVCWPGAGSVGGSVETSEGTRRRLWSVENRGACVTSMRGTHTFNKPDVFSVTRLRLLQ